MNDEKEKWAEEVFQSMKGSERAQPRPELLTKVKGQIALSKANTVPSSVLRFAAAAAVVILLVNTMALMYYRQDKQADKEEVAVADAYKQSPISDFQIYEQ